MGFGVWGLGFGVWGLGFGVWGLGLGLRVQGLGLSFRLNPTNPEQLSLILRAQENKHLDVAKLFIQVASGF